MATIEELQEVAIGVGRPLGWQVVPYLENGDECVIDIVRIAGSRGP